MKINEAHEANVRAISDLICGDHLQSRLFSAERFIAQSAEEGTASHRKAVTAMMLAACTAVRIIRSPYEGIPMPTPHAARLATDLLEVLPVPPTWAIEPIDRSAQMTDSVPFSPEERHAVLAHTEVIAERTHDRMREIGSNPLEVEELLLGGGSPQLYGDYAFLLCLNFRSVSTRLTPGRFEELLAQYMADSLRNGESAPD